MGIQFGHSRDTLRIQRGYTENIMGIQRDTAEVRRGYSRNIERRECRRREEKGFSFFCDN